MTSTEVLDLGRDFLALRTLKRRVTDDLNRCENVLLMYLRETDEKSIDVDGIVLRRSRGFSTYRQSPAERRRIRAVVAYGGIVRPWERPEQIKVDGASGAFGSAA